MTDNDESWARGRKWVGQACAAVGISPDDVDIPLILDLTREGGTPAVTPDGARRGLHPGSRPR